jgi:non-ribosomal peptide synthetase component E (peptide arylation enzyme)
MEKGYWIGRKHAAMGMARAAVSGEVRLIHYDLAGRYSIKAAQCLAARGAAEGERAMLHLPDPSFVRPGVMAPGEEGRLETRGEPRLSREDAR